MQYTFEGPQTQLMSMNSLDDMKRSRGVVIWQRTPLCCRCLCCQPNIHKNVYDYEEHVSQEKDLHQQMSILEESGSCGRTCSCLCPGCRATTYRVYRGNVEGSHAPADSLLMVHEKQSTFGRDFPLIDPRIRCPCCCNLPYLITSDPSGNMLGKSQFVFNAWGWCNPFVDVSDANGQIVFRVKADDCCFGCCMRPRCGNSGAKCCRIPFPIRDPLTEVPIEDAQVAEMWTGWTQMCCTRRMMYRVKFPPQSDAALRATLMGAALLIDLSMFEQRVE